MVLSMSVASAVAGVAPGDVKGEVSVGDDGALRVGGGAVRDANREDGAGGGTGDAVADGSVGDAPGVGAAGDVDGEVAAGGAPGVCVPGEADVQGAAGDAMMVPLVMF